MVPRKSKTFKVCSVLFCSLTKGVKSLNNDGKRTKVFKAQMVHSSWHLTQTCLSNMKWATSIVTCISPGWDAIPLQVTPQHSVRLPQQLFAETHLYSCKERGYNVRIKFLAHGQSMSSASLKLRSGPLSLPQTSINPPHPPKKIIIIIKSYNKKQYNHC